MFASFGKGVGNKGTGIASGSDALLAHKIISCLEKADMEELQKRLKKSKIDINAEIRFEQDLEKMTSLHYAAKKGYADTFERLVAIGADVNKITPFDQNSVLHFACGCKDEKASLKMVTHLISLGVDVSIENYCGRTPLVIASESGHREVVNVLCFQGVFIDHRFGEEEYTVQISDAIRAQQDRFERVDQRELREPYTGNTPVIQACREHHLGVVQELINHGCDVNIANNMGNTALHVACLSYTRSAFDVEPRRFALTGHKDIVGLLIQEKCALDELNAQGHTPLDRTINGIVEVDRCALAHCADEKAREINKLLEISQMLVNAGCDVTRTSEIGASILTDLLRVAGVISCYTTKKESLQRNLHKCARLILGAGCPLSDNDRDMIRTLRPAALAASIMEYSLQFYRIPHNLKEMAKFKLRQMIHRPLSRNIPRIPLPHPLQRYLLLQVED